MSFVLISTSVYSIVQLYYVGASDAGRMPRTESCCLIQDQLPVVLGFLIPSLCVLTFISKQFLLCKSEYVNKKVAMGAED